MMTEEIKKVPLILFSGGLDSTYLLWKTLETTDVDILYISGPQGPDKIKAEKEARNKILDYLATRRPYRVRTHFASEAMNEGGPEDGKYGQVLAWFAGAMQTCGARYHDSVQIAYICGDGSSAYASSIIYAWDHLITAVKHAVVPLRFPLIDTTKQEIMKHLPDALYKLTWVCEIPVTVSGSDQSSVCGKCTPCVTRKVEEFRWYTLNGYEYGNWLSRKPPPVTSHNANLYVLQRDIEVAFPEESVDVKDYLYRVINELVLWDISVTRDDVARTVGIAPGFIGSEDRNRKLIDGSYDLFIKWKEQVVANPADNKVNDLFADEIAAIGTQSISRKTNS